MDTLKVGVIGYGYWGPNLARNFAELSSADLVGIADLSDDQINRARSKFPEIVLTKDYHDLFGMGLDAVVIATPPAAHYPVAKEALENNLHVLVEKPITRTMQF